MASTRQNIDSLDVKSRRVKCKFCELIVTGPAYRRMHHLAGTHRDVQSCQMVPPDVKKATQFLIKLDEIERGLTEMKGELVEMRNLFST
jgi:hypothetical protein